MSGEQERGVVQEAFHESREGFSFADFMKGPLHDRDGLFTN
jgi:hypothetical protein